MRGHSLELSQHRGQHFSQLVHGWVTITAETYHRLNLNRLDNKCASISK